MKRIMQTLELSRLNIPCTLKAEDVVRLLEYIESLQLQIETLQHYIADLEHLYINQDNDTLRARVAELETALKPFTETIDEQGYVEDGFTPPCCVFCERETPYHTDTCRTTKARRALDKATYSK